MDIQTAKLVIKAATQADYLRECLQAVRVLDTKSISKEMLEKEKTGLQIGEAIRVAKINAIRGVYKSWNI